MGWWWGAKQRKRTLRAKPKKRKKRHSRRSRPKKSQCNTAHLPADIARWRKYARRRGWSMSTLVHQAIEALLGRDALPVDLQADVELTIGDVVYVGSLDVERAEEPRLPLHASRVVDEPDEPEPREEERTPAPAYTVPWEDGPGELSACEQCGAPTDAAWCARCGHRRGPS